jgi:predicted nucleotide-binding protein
MTDDILDDLIRAARRCERAARAFEAEPIHSMVSRLLEASRSVGNAASSSWFGYLATIYLQGFRPARPGEYFDTEWGGGDPGLSETTGGPWCEYTYKEVADEILRRAQVPDLALLADAARSATEAFDSTKAEVLPTLDAILTVHPDQVIKDLRTTIVGLESFILAEKFVKPRAPKRQSTRDPRAHQGGFQVPHHISFECHVLQLVSNGEQTSELAKAIRHAVTYLQKKHKMKGKTVAKTDGKIFIGHGRSLAWRDLKDFLQDRLGLAWDEFNREPTAGLSTKERLEAMLDNACFAFLVMTAEDEQADGSKRSRENVVHEAGLFQGRLGFQRAIVLLEQGCTEFSNISGLGQIRFGPGQLKAVFEEIRQVLEREKII